MQYEFATATLQTDFCGMLLS